MKPIGAFTLAFALAIVSATGSVAANPDEGGRNSTPEMMHGPAAGAMHMPMRAPSDALGWERPQLSFALQNRSELGLSAEQEKTLRQLVDRFGKEADQRMRDIEATERELAGLLKQEPVDLAQIESKVRAAATARADLRIARIRTIAEGRVSLTPEQRAKLDQLAAGQGQSRRGGDSRGAEEMQRFMSSGRMPQAMSAMMSMAERMGGGDTMLGMVRMMEMMSMMGGDGMMGHPERSQPRSEEKK